MTDGCCARVTRTGFAALIIAALCVGLAVTAHAGPANDTPFTLQQPDGTAFEARQFGDEWMNGTETVDGYTIVEHATSGYWTYADVSPNGTLVASPYVVGRDLPYALPQRVRPAVNRSRTATGPHALGFDAPTAFTGAHKMLVILVEFTDTPATTSVASWQSRFFGASHSVKDFYTRTSYGNLSITPAEETSRTDDDGIVGWLSLPTPHPNFGGAIDTVAQTLARDAMAAANPVVNFAYFDTNGDGIVSERELLIIIIVAGSESSFSSACAPKVWGHRWNIDEGVVLDGTTLSPYAMFGEKHCDHSASQPATVGIIVHETGHLLGLPDLYDIDGSSEGVGRWSVMGSGSWNQVPLTGRPGDSPSFMDPWSKLTLGWINPTRVTGTLTNQTIPDAAASPVVFRFRTGAEYFLVENRNQTSYDVGLPGNGLVIWHVDDTKTSNAEECIPRHPVVACSASVHPWVRVVQADNLYHLEHKLNRGDAGDPFPGTSNRTRFTHTSTPNSKLYSGRSGGMSVTDISAPGSDMTATLSAITISLSVTEPNGGEAWATGVPHPITWISSGFTGSVKIELSRDGGTAWTTLVASAANDGVYDWMATGPATHRARIRVCSVTTPTLCDTSNGNFLIGRTILVGSPNRGTWVVGTSKTIEWTSNMVTGDVKIDISRNGGTSWSTLVASTANDGTWAWTVAGRVSTAVRIRVCTIVLPKICDASTSFTIATGHVDLVTTAIDFATPVTRDATWSVHLVVQNTGTGMAPASQTMVYVSPDSTFSTSDYFIVTVNTPALEPGALSDTTSSITFPATMPAGDYFVGVLVDATGLVTETDENNWFYAPTTLLQVLSPPAPGATIAASSLAR